MNQDMELEANISHIIDVCLEEEKKEFIAGVESFQVYANRKRPELATRLHTFQKKYSHGYGLLCELFVADGQKFPEPSLDTLTDVQEGKSLYQMLGFSPEQMKQFYEVAYKRVLDSDFENAQDIFYFLVTIAPLVAPFWLGLGLCSAKVNEYRMSADAFLQAIKQDVQNPDAYVGAIHALVMLDALDEAQNVCDSGLQLAHEPLQQILLEAKRYVNSYHK